MEHQERSDAGLRALLIGAILGISDTTRRRSYNNIVSPFSRARTTEIHMIYALGVVTP